MANKAFLYLYPQKNIIDFQIENQSWNHENAGIQMDFESRFREVGDEYEKEKLREKNFSESTKSYSKSFSEILNMVIDERYRKNDFKIFFTLLDDMQISELIDVRQTDNLIYVGMDSKTHYTADSNGKHPYPDRDLILNQIGEVDNLVVSGFHLNDCVKKIARRAHLRGIKTLVDEELTELFGYNLNREDFDPKVFPSIDPREVIKDELVIDHFLKKRKNKPWLYQY